MSKKFKIILGITYLVILTSFLYLIFSNVQINRLNEFLYYKELQSNLSTFISTNLIINLFYYFIFAIIWVSLLGFASPILIISGIMFGKWLGTLISIISISIGVLILYSIGSFFFKELIEQTFKKKFERYIQIFKKNEFYYFFIYRFVGGLGVPFFLQNLLPVLFDMKKRNFFYSSLLGLIPSFFVFNSIGSGLNIYIKQVDKFNLSNFIFTPEIYLPIFMFLGLMVISFFIKKKFFNVSD